MPSKKREQSIVGSDRESMAGPSATGAGVGVFIVALSHLAPPAWRETLMLLTPPITLGVTGLTSWARSRIRQIGYERARLKASARLLAEMESILNDPHLTEAEKEQFRRAYAQTKSQQFDYDLKRAQAPTDALNSLNLNPKPSQGVTEEFQIEE